MHAPARRNIWALVRPYTRPQQLFLFRQLYPRRAAVSPSVPSSPPSLRLPLSPAAPAAPFVLLNVLLVLLFLLLPPAVFLPRLDSVNPP